jgi:hypothetical protein
MEKILNLLFDTFHSTKYFHSHLIHHSLSFLRRLLHLSKYNEIFMVDYVLHDEATIFFLDFSKHQKYRLML